MKKILIVVMALALMATGAKADCTYQEFANATSNGDFTYWLNLTELFDGDWETVTGGDGSAWHGAYANYTVPPGNNTASAWQVKYGTGPFISNLSVSACDFSTGTLMFTIESIIDVGASEQGSKWSCWNGTGWSILLYNSSTDEPPVPSRGSVYEEAMFWGECETPTTTTTTSTTSSTTSTSTISTSSTTTSITTTTIPISTTTTTIPISTTTTIPMNISCHMCNITNIGPEMGLGALVWAPICGFLEILFCVPILFALALIGVTFIAAWLSIRRR